VLAALAAGRQGNDGPARLAITVGAGEEYVSRAEAARTWLAEAGRRPAGMAFRPAAMIGEIGFVYASAAAAYPEMGRELLLAFPAFADPTPDQFDPSTLLGRLAGTARLARVQTSITRSLLGVRPDAALGYSSGESAALIALGAWTDFAALAADSHESGLFTTELAGEFRAARRAWARQGIDGHQWVTYLVRGPVTRVRALLAGESAVHLMCVNTPEEYVIGGEERRCARVLLQLDAEFVVPVDYNLAVHAPELGEVEDQWRTLHQRHITDVPGVRFYQSATARPFPLTTDSVADALTAQALKTLDFPQVIERAWADGIRIFVELGPKNRCAHWISRILGDREYVAVALDGPARGIRQLYQAVAELAAAGVHLNEEALWAHLAEAATMGPQASAPRQSRALSVPAPSPSPTEPVSPVPTLKAPLIGGLALNQNQQLAVAHRAFIAGQTQAHQQFLTLRQQAMDALIGSLAADSAGRSQVTFDRRQLEQFAAGRISELFGPRFAAQEGLRRQTRLPRPPLLLVDRVTALDAEPASMGTGTIWTETDVRAKSWFLDPVGRVPAGLLMEAGQGNLLLISWLGADLRNEDDRGVRLLGWELTFHGSLPGPGQTLRYQIRIDGHTDQGGVRLFSFSSGCSAGGRPVLTVRNGQLGFFTDSELAAGEGVRWDPAKEPPPSDAEPFGPPAITGAASSYEPGQVRAFAEGHPADCFGPLWKGTRAHVRTPHISAGRLLLLDRVTVFDPAGGPWKRGYLRAETSVSPDDWFFAAHFPADPCMPATLMTEGGLQAMAFFLTALGFTADRDGWRFEPVPELPYQMRYRGQVTPASRHLTYEVFVRGLHTGPEPTLFADVLCTVDGLPAFLVRRLGLRLVQDWPLEHWQHLGPPALQPTGQPVPLSSLGGLVGAVDSAEVAEFEAIRYDYATLLASAWGRPELFLPALVEDLPAGRRVPRLPGPPFLFLSRIRRIVGPMGAMQAGSWIETEYDVPGKTWFFDQNGTATMPLAALMEVMLQTSGYLASHVGRGVGSTGDVYVRNLDGSGVFTAQVSPRTRSLATRAELRSATRMGDVVIQRFDLYCHAEGEPVFTGSATFGIFPKATLANQQGIPPTDAERDRLAEPDEFFVDLRRRPARYCGGPLRLAGPMLLMLDRVTGFWPDRGVAGLGRLRAEFDVDADAWYFKSHFFGDPVQPGSLGNEAVCQLLQFFLIETGASVGLPHPVFEPVMIGTQVTWKYRGQVVPTDQRVTIEMEILEAGDDERGRFARAEAWLWVDGRRIYHVQEIGMRVVSGEPIGTSAAEVDHFLDPAIDTWVGDHRPLWTVPALPMTSTADLIARAASDYFGAEVTALRDLRLRRWIVVAGPVRLRTRVERMENDLKITLYLWSEAENEASFRFVPVATAIVPVNPPSQRPEPFRSLTDLESEPLPYETAEMFHGPAFQYLTSWRLGPTGASGTIDAGHGQVPRGCLHPGLLDAMFHVIPHHRMGRWSSHIASGRSAFPSQLLDLQVFEPLPDSGELQVEARFAGFHGDDSGFPVCDLQLCRDGRVIAAMRLVQALSPQLKTYHPSPLQKRAFLRDLEYVEGLGISTTDDASTTVQAAEVALFDSLSGTVDAVYRLPTHSMGPDRLARIAIADHIARLLRLHPSQIEVSRDLRTANPKGRPEQQHHVHVVQRSDRAIVCDAQTREG
jgi:3-hydroxymyristoyl/3-hydroxydecanoyl-(acyl carrier protein) dehydratase